MTIYYNNLDITDQVNPVSCEHDMYLTDRADTLMVEFENVEEGQWSKWAPEVGDMIRITEGYDDTGIMYVNKIQFNQGYMKLTASSIKDKPVKTSKSWQDVSLLQIAKYIATEHDLELEKYGVTDQKYSYVSQDNEDDFTFLNRRLRLEGAGFLVYDGKLIIHSQDYLDSLAIGTAYMDLEDDSIRITDDPYLGSCTVTNGDLTGKYIEDSTLESAEFEIHEKIDSLEQANRWAEKRLQYENSKKKVGVAYSEELMTGIMAGTKLTMNSGYWTKFPALITHVRYNLTEGEQKMWFRKVIEDE